MLVLTHSPDQLVPLVRFSFLSIRGKYITTASNAMATTMLCVMFSLLPATSLLVCPSQGSKRAPQASIRKEPGNNNSVAMIYRPINIMGAYPRSFRLRTPSWFALAYSATPTAAVGNSMRSKKVFSTTIPILDGHL